MANLHREALELAIKESKENASNNYKKGGPFGAAILKDGKIAGIIRKSLLPNYSEFNDYRYIEPSPVVGVQPTETLGIFDKDAIKDCSKIFEKYGISIVVSISLDKEEIPEALQDKIAVAL